VCVCRTLFAPTNAAFESPDLKARTGLTAAQFLETANKEALVKVRALVGSYRYERTYRLAASSF